MLLEFKFHNFRSFRGSGSLNLAASNYVKELPGNLLEPALPGMKNQKFLRGAAIYGANASGKSNVIRALFEFQRLVRNSHRFEAGSGIEVNPFVLDEASMKTPTAFGVRFVAEGIRYHYSVAYDRERFLEEELSAFPKKKEQLWFSRSWDPEKRAYDYEAGESFSLRKQDIESTKENSLLLSTAANLLNHPKLGPVYAWFRDKLEVRNLGLNGTGLDPRDTIKILQSGQKGAFEWIKKADLGISGFRLQTGKIDPVMLDRLPPIQRDRLADQEVVHLKLLHSGGGGSEHELDLDDESSGTIRFFELVGPWLAMIEDGKTLVVDELETSLHPLLVRELVRLVMNPEINRNGAQLIVATHDPLLLDLTLLRRDQIWLTEKSAEGESYLYALSDYKKPPTNRESLVRGYLAGRYGGIPFIPEGLMEIQHPVGAGHE
jgi:hypothetical protein